MIRATVAFILALAVAASAPVARNHYGTGTVTGRIVADTAAADSTFKPLAYANIILVGTNLGAMSLADGKYTIKGVPPGTYTVRAMMMGYKNVEIRRVKVTAGAAATADFVMKETVVARTQEIVVTGEKAMVEVTSSATVGTVTSEQLVDMPVDDVLKAVRLKAGDQMHVRGGRGGEAETQIDGAAVHDPLAPEEPELKRSPQLKYQTVTPQSIEAIRRRSEHWNTEDYSHISENEFRYVFEHPLSTFSVDVDAASYSNMRRFVTQGALPPRDAVRIEEMINYFQYDYPEPRGQHPFSITTELAQCPWNTENRLVHIGLQGRRIACEDLPPANLVFLLDVSGSMQSTNKLPLLKKAFLMLLDNLRRQDRVAIVVYAGAAGLVLDSTSGCHREIIRGAIDRLQAGGSTAGAAGIRLAYQVAQENFIKGGNNRVILATDGDFNVGVSSDGELTAMIEDKRKSGVFLTVLGFGMGNLKDNKMEQLADHGNGNYAYIDDIFEARKVMVNELGAMFTIAKDVKIQIEFNPMLVAAYRLVGYENRLLNREDFDNDKKDAGEIGAGHSVTALYEVVPRSAMSEGVTDIDDGLKYTTTYVDPKAAESNELLTVRFRYKAPDADESQLIEQTLTERRIDFARATDDFRFSAAVAEFGMLLRGSKFKRDASYEHVLDVARHSRGKDARGYRSEFVRLVEVCRSLDRNHED